MQASRGAQAEPMFAEKSPWWRGPVVAFLLTAAVVFAGLWAWTSNSTRTPLASTSSKALVPTPLASSHPALRTKPIEALVPGDQVLARDPQSGATRAKKVLRAFRNISDHLRLLSVGHADGTVQVLRTTDGHPFWVPSKGWVSARELKVGDELATAVGDLAVVEGTVYEAHPEGVPIFNVEVEDFHSYFVSAHGSRAPPILVHNTSPNPNNASPRPPGEATPVRNAPDEINFGRAGRTVPDEINFGRAGRTVPDEINFGRAGRTVPDEINFGRAGHEIRLRPRDQWQHVTGRRFPETAEPNSVRYRTSNGRPDGPISHIQLYDEQGRAWIRIDLTGRAHGGIEPPHAHIQPYDAQGRPQRREPPVGLRSDEPVRPQDEWIRNLLRAWLEGQRIPLP